MEAGGLSLQFFFFLFFLADEGREYQNETKSGPWMDSKAFINGPRRKKKLSSGFASNKGADQPGHPRRLISAFVIRCFEKYHM